MNTKEYLLVCLMEECNEVAHAASKILRFGPYDRHPSKSENNLQTLNTEFNQLMVVIEQLKLEGIYLFDDYFARSNKLNNLHNYMQYSSAAGCLKDADPE